MRKFKESLPMVVVMAIFIAAITWGVFESIRLDAKHKQVIESIHNNNGK